ncbi:MAG: YoaK family protein, partial [Leuconostoc mesenteroides]
MILKNKNPMQERLRIGLLLVMNSGFIDSYTFEYHHERFASLQTGNIIQAGFHLAQGHWKATLFFVIPIIFFVLGAAFNTVLNHFVPAGKLSLQQHSILIEFIGIAMI